MRRIPPRITQRIALTVMWGLGGITVSILFFIIAYILVHGLPHVTWTFLTQAPANLAATAVSCP